MTAKEKKLIYIMLIIIGLGIMLKGLPYAYDKYTERKAEITALKDKREKLQNLISKKVFWKQEYDKAVKQQKRLESELFLASSNELVAAKVQSSIKKLAKKEAVRIESIKLAEFQHSEYWLLVSLTVNFKGSSESIINFLTSLKNNPKKLLITGISIRSYRNNLNGNITLVGFSKKINKEDDS